MGARDNKLTIGDVFMGGLADSKYAGPPNSVADILGFDIFSTPGLMKVNQKLSKISGTTIDDTVLAMVSCSDGSIYAFGSTNGKIWKIASDNTVTLEATASPAAGTAGIVDAREYRGKIYYAMSNRLGQWTIGTNWSTRNDNFGTFAIGSTEHPMEIIDNLLIGDGQNIAEVDYLHAFATSVFEYPIESKYTIRCLANYDDYLFIGTHVSDDVAEVKLFYWNTWSPLPDGQDVIPEVGINAFIKSDNFLFAQCGISGRFYYLNGSKLEAMKTLPGDFSPTKTAKMYPNASTFFNNRSHLALSNVEGNPLDQVVFSWGNNRAGYNRIWSKEYPVSLRDEGNYVVSDLTIGAMVVRAGKIYVAWSNSSTHGVDEIDHTAKLEYAYLDSRVLKIDRTMLSNFNAFHAAYDTLPEDTSIELWFKPVASSFASVDAIVDTQRNIVRKDTSIEAVASQVRVRAISDGNNAPVLEDIYLEFT